MEVLNAMSDWRIVEQNDSLDDGANEPFVFALNLGSGDFGAGRPDWLHHATNLGPGCR